MSTTGWVVVAVVVIVGLAVVWGVVSSRRRARQLEVRRDAAAAHRDEAEVRERSAESARLEAEEQAARAERERLEAEAKVAEADRERSKAEEHQTLADQIDPDVEPTDHPEAKHAETSERGSRPES